MRPIIKSALAIEELAYTLDNISIDDKVSVESYTDEQIVNEAKYVLDLFVNPSQGHINHEAWIGDEGPEQKAWARKQVRQLKAFIKQYA
jgi:hypothetical protein